MASLSASCLRFQPSLLQSNKTSLKTSVNSISVNRARNGLRSSRLRISCAAKPETVNKVCEVVKKHLALDDSVSLTPETKFSELGADSLDTVEIVMSLEEEFNINVEEDSSQNIATVQDAADLIQNLIEKAPAS